MFFCKNCMIKNSWPESIFTSYGRCEICGISSQCFDVPSKFLTPIVRPEDERDAGYRLW